MNRVAVIGLGRMGRGIAKRLLVKGYDVLGYDINPNAYADLKGLPRFMALRSLSETVGEAQYALLLLPNGDAVMGSLPFLKDFGGTVINMTTIGLDEELKVENMVQDLHSSLLTAMIEGGPANAEAGTMVFYVGGPENLYRSSEQLLKDLGVPIYVGSHRAAVALKLISTLILMANTVVLAEVSQALRSLGIEPDLLVKALSMGGADSAQLRARLPIILSGEYRELFSIELGDYVARKAIEALKELGSSFVPVLSEVVESLSAARMLGLGRKDIAEVAELYRALALSQEGVKS